MAGVAEGVHIRRLGPRGVFFDTIITHSQEMAMFSGYAVGKQLAAVEVSVFIFPKLSTNQTEAICAILLLDQATGSSSALYGSYLADLPQAHPTSMVYSDRVGSRSPMT